MRITNAHVAFVSIKDQYGDKTYLDFASPFVVIEKGKKDRRYDCLKNLRFTLKEYHGTILFDDYIVITTDTEYIFVWDDVIEHASLSIEEVGEIIGIVKEGPIMHKKDRLWYYDKNAVCIKNKTAQEIDPGMIQDMMQNKRR